VAVVRVTFTASLYSSILQNVWHFSKSDYVTADLPVLLANLRDHWLDVYKNLMVAETVLISLHGEEMVSGGGGDVSNLLLSMVGGAGSDVRVPLMMSLVLQLRTGLGGRHNRGRIFVPGSSVAFTQNGLYTGAYLATVTPICTTLEGRWTGGSPTYGWNLVIWTRGDFASSGRAVTTIQPRATPGTQRRRELGVGI